MTRVLFVLVCLSWQYQATSIDMEEPACTSTECLPIGQGEIGASLLQVKQGEAGLAGKISESHVSAIAGVAQHALPKEIYDLGMKSFGSEEALDKVVAESTMTEIEYAGVSMKLRFLAKDTAAARMGAKTEDGSEYGLGSLLDTRASAKDMLNMIDMGGNYGTVSIAVYKKYPDLVRAVVVEPVAATYFFMRWNMYINNVPYLSKEEFANDASKPGVLALHGGITATSEPIQLCSHPEWSMNARSMNDHARQDGGDCDCEKMVCSTVPGYTTQGLFDDHFGQHTVNLLKMDCEGCEFEALPFLAKHPEKLKRLVGELHVPAENLIDTACLYDNGKYFTKVCRLAETEWASSLPLGCGEPRKKCRW